MLVIFSFSLRLPCYLSVFYVCFVSLYPVVAAKFENFEMTKHCQTSTVLSLTGLMCHKNLQISRPMLLHIPRFSQKLM